MHHGFRLGGFLNFGGGIREDGLLCGLDLFQESLDRAESRIRIRRKLSDTGERPTARRNQVGHVAP